MESRTWQVWKSPQRTAQSQLSVCKRGQMTSPFTIKHKRFSLSSERDDPWEKSDYPARPAREGWKSCNRKESLQTCVDCYHALWLHQDVLSAVWRRLGGGGDGSRGVGCVWKTAGRTAGCGSTRTAGLRQYHSTGEWGRRQGCVCVCGGGWSPEPFSQWLSMAPALPRSLSASQWQPEVERRRRAALNIYDYTKMYDFHLTAAQWGTFRNGSVLGVSLRSKHIRLRATPNHASFMKPTVEGRCQTSAVVSCTMKEFSLRHMCDRLQLVRG